MSDHVIFMMGNFEARFPTDRKYCRNHMWIKTEGRKHRFGFSGYAVRLLQDVYFLDWNLDAPAEVQRGQEIGSIESSKALSSLFAPIDGSIVGFNEDLLDDPSTINVDGYGAGWIFDMSGDGSVAIEPEDYIQFLDEGWEATQRALKKQL
tara:strand:+ start:587 stop:1036 length:450 start_codon:yes stop_codon:yes gene_type:complete